MQRSSCGHQTEISMQWLWTIKWTFTFWNLPQLLEPLHLQKGFHVWSFWRWTVLSVLQENRWDMSIQSVLVCNWNFASLVCQMLHDQFIILKRSLIPVSFLYVSSRTHSWLWEEMMRACVSMTCPHRSVSASLKHMRAGMTTTF